MSSTHTDRRRFVFTLVLMPLLLLATSCAVLFRGSNQGIPFDSNPQGAEVYLDGELMGVTPITVELWRGSGHMLMVRLGDQMREIIVTNSVDPLGGGLLFVDVAPGGAIAVAAATAQCNPGEGWFDFSDMCRDMSSLGIGIGVATAALPLVIDVATGAFYELSPGEVIIDFESANETPEVE